MGFSDSSKWIWTDTPETVDSYAEFISDFEYSGGSARVRISADSNYILYINGQLASFGQYPDFPHYKVYAEEDIAKYCKIGKNTVSVTVWYYGISNMSYYPGRAALRFEIFGNDGIILCSDENILSRIDTAYQNGRGKNITSQIGLGFAYDCTVKKAQSDFKPSRIVEQTLSLYKKPIKNLTVGERVCSSPVNSGDGYIVFDLGREEVGFLTLKLFSDKKQTLTVSYGEHINDGGRVRRIIEERDFSVEITVGEGENEYTNCFKRLGLRYLEICFESPVRIEYASVIPVSYPLNKIEKHFKSELHQRIYDVSVRTLELCMHDHYEDCPWREQGLYSMDGRNQILCGYYAFGEYEFPRASLYLMSKDDRADGLLSICTPTKLDLTIPSFSLHYFTEIYEYSVYSSDLSLANEVMPKLVSIMNVFLSKMKNGLVPRFTEKCHWNFYEWSRDLAGTLGQADDSELFDATLNCLLSTALEHLEKLCNLLGVSGNGYASVRKTLNERINEMFFDQFDGLYFDSSDKKTKSELANALAILSGAAEGERAKRIAQALASGGASLTEVTLSMSCFKYDALLKTNAAKYRDFIINDIEKRYSRMLENGATSFWETEKGAADFNGAGSLCHGWSAMPVYYFEALLN